MEGYATVFLDFVIVLVKAGVVLFALLNLAALLTWAERKQSAFMQDASVQIA